jgi:flavin reductase (DIM6/NTAB) family NADH-FMN oxidoreductase RutF
MTTISAAPAIATEPDAATLRRVFSAFPSGVAVLAAATDNGPIGMAVSSFTSVSLNPPLASVCAAAQSRTWPGLSRAYRIGVSVLADVHEEVSRRLAARDGDRFAGFQWRHGCGEAIFLHGAAAWLNCSVEREIPAGDHSIAVLRIHDLGSNADVAPLVFHGSRYRTLAP